MNRRDLGNVVTTGPQPAQDIVVMRSGMAQSAVSAVMARLMLTPDEFSSSTLVADVSPDGIIVPAFQIRGLSDAVVDVAVQRICGLIRIAVPWGSGQVRAAAPDTSKPGVCVAVPAPVRGTAAWLSSHHETGAAWIDVLAASGGGSVRITADGDRLALRVESDDPWAAHSAAELLSESIGQCDYEPEDGMSLSLLDVLFDQFRGRMPVRATPCVEAGAEGEESGQWLARARRHGHRVMRTEPGVFVLRMLGEHIDTDVEFALQHDPCDGAWMVIRTEIVPAGADGIDIKVAEDLLRLRYPAIRMEETAESGRAQLWVCLDIPAACHDDFRSLLRLLLNARDDSIAYLVANQNGKTPQWSGRC